MTRRSPSVLWPTALCLCLLTAAVTQPLFADVHAWGRQDWDQFTFRYETARLALVQFGEWPSWNPYANGGTVLFAHPHHPSASPWFLITLLSGTTLGLRLQVTLFLALGAIGMARLTSVLGASPAGALAAGVVYAFGSHPVLHVAEGHVEWAVIGLMPWTARPLLQWRDHHPWRPVVTAAAFFASAVLLGAVYIPAVFAVCFSVWSLCESARHRSWRPLRHWVAIAVLAGGLSAVKLLPMAYFVRHAEAAAPAGHYTSPRTLLAGLFDPRQAEAYQALRGFRAGGQTDAMPPATAPTYPWGPLSDRDLPFEFHEYAGYVSAVGWLVVAFGLAWAWRDHWPWLVTGGLTLWIALGAAAPVDAWAWLRTLPLYASLHVPSRFLAGATFTVAIVVAAGLTALAARLPRVRWVAPLLVAAITLELGLMARRVFADVFVVPPVAIASTPAFANAAPPDALAALTPGPMHSVMTPMLRAGYGSVDGYENLQVPRGNIVQAGTAGYRGETWLEGTTGTATLTTLTMGTVRVAIAADGPGRLVVNQNFFPGWRGDVFYENDSRMQVDVGPSEGGLVTTAIDAHVRVVLFRYRPPLLRAGLALTTLTLVACVGLWRRR